MATTRTAAGTGIKDQINEQSPSPEQVIRKSIHQDFVETGISAVEILGEMAWPFVGLHAPAHHSFPQDNSTGSDTVLTDLIVYFANQDNQNTWPTTYYPHILNTLHHLLKMVETVRKYGDTVFHITNLYQLKQRQEQANQLLDDLNGWYGDGYHTKVSADQSKA